MYMLTTDKIHASLQCYVLKTCLEVNVYVLPSYFRVKGFIHYIRFGSVMYQGKTLNYPSVSISSNVDSVSN